MTGTLGALAMAAALFVVTHVGLSSSGMRRAVVGALGETGFTIAYGILSLALLVWMALAYRAAPVVPVWPSTVFFRHLAGSVMVLAAILAFAGVTVRNPMAMGPDVGAALEAPVPGPLRVTRHPLMWAIGLWAGIHALANGDAASLILFGAIGVLAFGGTVLIDRKRERAFGARWQAFAARTSNVPFVAILARRARFSFREFGWWRILGGILLYLVLLFGHEPVFGVWPLHVQ